MRYFKKAPEIPSANIALGAYYEKQSDNEKAISYYTRAGDLPAAKDAIARLEKG
jgi:hypothetical protein